MAYRSAGYNQDAIQEMNRSLIISLLRQEGVCARSRLAQLTGLKQATITNIISWFIQWKLVREVSFLTGEKGRRSIGIAIDCEAYSVIGIRLSRNCFTVGLFDLTGKLTADCSIDIAKNEKPEQICDAIIAAVNSMLKKNVQTKVLCLGVALPGPFITKNEQVAIMSKTSEWQKVSLKNVLEKAFSRPTFLEHDANAAVLAQLRHDKDVANACCLAYIAAGQGIGAGIIHEGELLKGQDGIAGEIGHTSIDYDGPSCPCGNKGCLELYCSSRRFAGKVNAKLGAALSLPEIQARIASGDAVCSQEYSMACAYLGFGIVNLIYNFNPGVIVIGDEMAHIAPDLMLQSVKRVVSDRVLPVVAKNLGIKISNAIKNSALHGAGIVAIAQIFNNPSAFIENHSANVAS